MTIKDHIQPLVDVEDHCCGQDCGFFGDDDICSLTEKRRQVKKSYNPALIEAAQAVLEAVGNLDFEHHQNCSIKKPAETCDCGLVKLASKYQAYLRIAGDE